MPPTIHQRAEQLVRESHGKMNMQDAYRELSRRACKVRRRAKFGTMPLPQRDPFDPVERPFRLPYIDN